MPKESAVILPDFVLAGAPKCGTGSLFGWLADHPQLQGSNPKEPFYFMDPGNPLMAREANVHRLGLAGWSKAFATGTREAGKLYFEGTTHLIYQRTALSILPGLATRPKLIFLLRDPIERLISSFVYTQNNLAQVRSGFTLDQYLEMIAEGRLHELERFIFSRQSAFVLQRDLQYSNYWHYLEQWRGAVGSERMLVLQFEQLIAQPTAVMRRVCNFLEISASHFEDDYAYPAHNLTMRIANTSIHRWAQHWANLLPTGQFKQTLSRVYYRLQRRKPERMRSQPSPQLLEMLRERLGPNTLTLARQFDLDLRLWKSIAQAEESDAVPASQSQRRPSLEAPASSGTAQALLKGKNA